MKTAYINLSDHHDPLWNKAFEEHAEDTDGSVLRSYSEREASQFDRWFDILPNTPAAYEIEQTCTIKKYLEQNPDKLPLVRELTRKGQIEHLGGGEAVIDYNLVHGESIYRNFLYSFRWLKETFNVRPQTGAAPDTFGLSAQVPQIFSQFDLPWLPIHSRMFGGNSAAGMETEHVLGQPDRPYWRGIDGTLMCIRSGFFGSAAWATSIFVNHQYRRCPVCQGAGCRFCEYSGMDMHVEHGANCLQDTLKQLSEGPHDTAVIHITTEETVKTSSFVADTLALGARMGVEIRFVTHAQIRQTRMKPHLDRILAGTVTTEEIDVRAEGNPIATGCYITRSGLKRQNRELEHLLLAAEKFSAFAAAFDYAYPRRGFARWWNLMSLLQFHDSITASHPDGPLRELQKWNRQVRRGAGRHMLEACARIGAQIQPPPPGPDATVAVFNPLNWEVTPVFTEVVIRAADLGITKDEQVTEWTLTSADGSRADVLEWARIEMPLDTVAYRLKCRCAGLPACGYATLRANPSKQPRTQPAAALVSGVLSRDAEAAGLQASAEAAVSGRCELDRLTPGMGNSIANERYRIDFDARGITGIFDKSLNRLVAGKGTADLMAEDDIGSFWDRLKFFNMRKNLSDLATMTVRSYTGAFQRLVIQGTLPKRLEWELPRDWRSDVCKANLCKIRDLTAAEVEVLIDSLSWTTELSLYPGSNRIDIRTTIACDSQNVRLLVPFPFGFTTPQDRAWYEIPYGMIERPSYRPKAGVHCNPDGVWPAVHWAAAVNRQDNYTCALLNKGIAAHRFKDGVMEVALQRSPRLRVWNARSLECNRLTDPSAKDAGLQVHEYAFLSGPGDVAANRLTHQGYEFNSVFPSVVLQSAEIARLRQGRKPTLPARHSFLQNSAPNVIIPVVKRAEDSDDLVLRMTEVYGVAAADALIGPCGGRASAVSPLENEPLAQDAPLQFRPFEIKTVTISKG
ncbi:MAG: hypothetical protein FJ222_06030 [Lentisphaerae bacterium]|nr:hypothetical protein [Lentisphaerota bacterium]